LCHLRLRFVLILKYYAQKLKDQAEKRLKVEEAKKLKEEANRKAKEDVSRAIDGAKEQDSNKAPDEILTPLLGKGLQEKVTDQSDSTTQPLERKASYEDTVALIATIENNVSKGSPLKPDKASYVDTVALISKIEETVDKGSHLKSDDNKSKPLAEVKELEHQRNPLNEVIWHWISERMCCKRNR